MYKEIKIGDSVYPIKFGINAVRLFCDKFKISLADLNTALNSENLTLTQALYLCFCGLKDGHRKAKKPFNFVIDDIADLMDEDEALVEKIMEVFIEQMSSKSKKKTQTQKKVKNLT